MGSSMRKGRREASRAEARLPEPELVAVFVTVAVRTSSGPRPDPVLA